MNDKPSKGVIIAKVLMVIGGIFIGLFLLVGLYLLLEVFVISGDGKEFLLFFAFLTFPFWIWVPILGFFLFFIGLMIYLPQKDGAKEKLYDTFIKEADGETSEIKDEREKE